MCNDVSRKLLPLQREGWDGHGFEKLALRHLQADVPHPPRRGRVPMRRDAVRRARSDASQIRHLTPALPSKGRKISLILKQCIRRTDRRRDERTEPAT